MRIESILGRNQWNSPQSMEMTNYNEIILDGKLNFNKNIQFRMIKATSVLNCCKTAMVSNIITYTACRNL